VWTIAAARRSRVARTLVTTDDPSIAEVARGADADVPFMRPAALASDDTPGTDPILHAVEWLEQHEGYRPELVASLQPTSPFRTAADIDAAVELLVKRNAETVVSVTPSDSHPYWAKRLTAGGWLAPFLDGVPATFRRQDLPEAFALNGAIYLARREVLLATRGWYTDRTAAYVMPPERSLDVDTPWHLALARLLAGSMPHDD
jgi:N-acylneuraminate cytidylyltransferase/CMP-N,N'-diacetyllegionaminic acid synthase